MLTAHTLAAVRHHDAAARRWANLQAASHQNAGYSHLLSTGQTEWPGKPYGQKKDDDVCRHVQTRARQVRLAFDARSRNGPVPVPSGRLAVVRPSEGLRDAVSHGNEHGEIGGKSEGPA